jgi:DNA-directed RNA polymerase specialized sigma24 family protein
MIKPSLHGKNTWRLTHENFAALLAALDADPERAGELYEQLRRKLVSLFMWRGSATPDELADETLDRLARKIDEGEVVRNVPHYVGGIARLVWLESLKAEARERSALEELGGASRVDPAHEESARAVCFESCLANLPAESRALILDYYREEKTAKIALRKQLAEKLGTPPNALRIRAHRIRVQLETCVADCLGKSEQP